MGNLNKIECKTPVGEIPEGTRKIAVDIQNATTQTQNDVLRLIGYTGCKIVTNNGIVNCSSRRKKETAAYQMEITGDVIATWKENGVEVYIAD